MPKIKHEDLVILSAQIAERISADDFSEEKEENFTKRTTKKYTGYLRQLIDTTEYLFDKSVPVSRRAGIIILALIGFFLLYLIFSGKTTITNFHGDEYHGNVQQCFYCDTPKDPDVPAVQSTMIHINQVPEGWRVLDIKKSTASPN